MACFAECEPDGDSVPVDPTVTPAYGRVAYDRYAREIPLDQWGQPVPTVWLDDIRFRRYNLILREPLGDVARGIDGLLGYLDEEVYSEPRPNGGRTLRDGIDPLRALAVVAQQIEGLKRSMSRVDVARLGKEWLNNVGTVQDVADRGGGGGVHAAVPLPSLRPVGVGGDPGDLRPGGLVPLASAQRPLNEGDPDA